MEAIAASWERWIRPHQPFLGHSEVGNCPLLVLGGDETDSEGVSEWEGVLA